MSRIGKEPIKVPANVQVSIEGQLVKVKGPKGQLERELHPTVKASQSGDEIKVELVSTGRGDVKFHGLSRTLVNNMVLGVSTGFTKSLSLVGVGYRAALEGKGLNMTLGYSHPIKVPEVEGITFAVEKNTTVTVSGASKELVGQIAANIRKLRPPEPYHGKGVRYTDERILTKVGKAAGKK